MPSPRPCRVAACGFDDVNSALERNNAPRRYLKMAPRSSPDARLCPEDARESSRKLSWLLDRRGDKMRSSLSTFGIVALPVLTLLASVPLLAQQPIEQLVTPAGILSVKSATGSDCAPSVECQVIVLNGTILFKEQHATLVSAYPSKEAPRLVEVQT